jgi:hypothetical protein
MKKLILLTLLFLLFLSLSIQAQKSWNENVVYKSKGPDLRTCDSTIYERTELNSYGAKVITGYYQKCRVMVWESEYYSGYVAVWAFGEWEAEWADGTFWKCHYEDKNFYFK